MDLLVSISRNIYSLDESSMKKASLRWDDLLHPPKSLGMVEKIPIMMAGVYGNANIEDSPKKCVISFASDNGVYAEGVSPQPQEITSWHFKNFVNGKSALGTFSRFANVDVIAVDIGMNTDEKIDGVYDYKIRKGTDNIAIGPAMSVDEAVKAIEIGILVAEKCIVDGYRLIGIGEMGISNTTTSTAIISVLSGKDPIEITGRRVGLDDEFLRHKAEVIRRSIEVNNPNPTDGIEVLSKVGGFDIGGMTGVILGCAANRTPVVLDGYISYAAALIAYKINPKSREYLIASHRSKETGSDIALDILKLKPMLDMGMCLGEGSGAALAMNIIDASIFSYNNMGKFSETDFEDYLGKPKNNK